jgi:hypothetical protein
MILLPTALLSEKDEKCSHQEHKCFTCIKVFSLVSGYKTNIVAKCFAHIDQSFKTSVMYANSLNKINISKKFWHFEFFRRLRKNDKVLRAG